MARVEIIVKESKVELVDAVNKIIQNLKFKEFDIRYSANESYPDEADRNSPERFFSAMIILKDKE